jgi:hypothetical protein
MAIFERIEKFYVLQKVPIQRIPSRIIGVRSNDQGFRTPEFCKGSKIRALFVGRGIQDEDVTSPNGQFNTGNEEDTLFLGEGKKFLIEGHLVMIGDGNHIKTFVGGFGDELFTGVPNAIERVFRRVKMEISFQGLCFFYFHMDSLVVKILSAF